MTAERTPTGYEKRIGKELRRLRLSKRMSQADLGRSSHVTDVSICMIEQGRRMNLRTLRVICRRLGVKLWEVLRTAERTP